MNTLLRGCGCLLLLFVLALGGGAFWLWKAKQELPADVQRETLFAAHRDLLNRLDSAIRSADSFADAADRLRAVATDADLLYLQLTEADGMQRIDVRKRLTSADRTTILWNGVGGGTVRTEAGTQEIRIISNSERTAAGMLVTYTLYLAYHQAPSPAPADEPLERAR